MAKKRGYNSNYCKGCNYENSPRKFCQVCNKKGGYFYIRLDHHQNGESSRLEIAVNINNLDSLPHFRAEIIDMISRDYIGVIVDHQKKKYKNEVLSFCFEIFDKAYQHKYRAIINEIEQYGYLDEGKIDFAQRRAHLEAKKVLSKKFGKVVRKIKRKEKTAETKK